jgi:hypothetical protein
MTAEEDNRVLAHRIFSAMDSLNYSERLKLQDDALRSALHEMRKTDPAIQRSINSLADRFKQMGPAMATELVAKVGIMLAQVPLDDEIFRERGVCEDEQ